MWSIEYDLNCCGCYLNYWLREWVYEHTNSRRISGGNYSVSIDVGVQLESYPDTLMTTNFSSREDGACGERSDKCQNSVKIHNKLWHLCFKFVLISYWFSLNLSFNHMLPSFDLRKSFDPILCVFQERLKRTQEEWRRKQETEKIEKKCCQGRSNQSILA